MSDIPEFLKFLEARLTESGRVLRALPLRTLRLLASQHADHPEYRQEWRP